MSTQDSTDHLDSIRLAPFLRYLADSLENNTLSPDQVQRIGEFFMAFLFAEEAKKDKNITTENTIEKFVESDFKKFLVLGWYVYSHLLEDTTLSCGENTAEL